MGCFDERTEIETVRILPRKVPASITIALLVLGVAALPASAASNSRNTSEARAVRLPQQQVVAASARPQYAIEFRARYAQSYGHTYVTFGRLDDRGRLINREVAGFHPTGDTATNWMLGHLVPVVSETGPSDGDLEDQYTAASFRVTVDEAEYRRVLAYIRHKQANSGPWHAVFNNCSMWVGDIANYMGLKAPNHMLMPPNYINTMRQINAGNARTSGRSRQVEASAN